MTMPGDEDLERQEAAASWCLRVSDQDMSSDEQAELERWLNEDPRNDRAFREMMALLAGTDAIAERPEIIAARADALSALHEATSRPPRFKLQSLYPLGMAAACVVILVLVGLHWARIGNFCLWN